jgi:hypothetical protein
LGLQSGPQITFGPETYRKTMDGSRLFIQQGLYYLGIGARKHEFDQRLGLVER